MKTISAREANQKFSKLLSDVGGGEEVVITRRGIPIARIVPAKGAGADADREAAIARMSARLRKGVSLGNEKATREEMHER